MVLASSWHFRDPEIAFPDGTRLEVPLSVLTHPITAADRRINE